MIRPTTVTVDGVGEIVVTPSMVDALGELVAHERGERDRVVSGEIPPSTRGLLEAAGLVERAAHQTVVLTPVGRRAVYAAEQADR